MPGTRIRRSDDLRTENRFRVLSSLRSAGPSTRAELGKATGLSAAAVSTLTTAMLGEGLLQASLQDASRPSRRGRPQSSITLAAGPATAVTVLLTIDRLQVLLLDYNGVVLARGDVRLSTRRLQADALIAAMRSAIDDVLDPPARQRLRQVGVGFQGMTDTASGTLLWSPILDVSKVPLAAALTAAYQVPVSVHSDCRLIADAIHHRDRHRVGDSFLCVLYDHGIGLGLYINGAPFCGPRSSALEFGHILHERRGARCRCGRQGCIEAYAADYGIAREALADTAPSEPPGRVSPRLIEQLVARALAGDALACTAFERAGTAIGRGLATLFLLFDPMPVAFVGHTSTRYSLMRDAMAEAMREARQTHVDLDSLVHLYDDEVALLHSGLALDSLARIDRLFADTDVSADSRETQVETGGA